MAVDIGPKIGIDGEAEFRKEINSLIQQQKTLASEMKAVTSSFDKNDKSQEALTAQSKVLNQQIQIQQQRVEKLKEGLAAAAKEFGETDSKTLRWRQSVNYATADLNKMKEQLSGLEDSVEDVGEALEDTKDKTLSFSDLIGSNLITEGVKEIVQGVSDLVEQTKEYRSIMASLDVSSSSAGYTAKETAQSYRQLFGVLGDTQQAATTTANLQALKLSQEQLVQMINSAIGAWAKYGDSIPIDGLAEAINETVKTAKVTGTFADVLNWAGQSEDAFNDLLAAAASESERANLVLQAMADQGLAAVGEAWQQNNKDIVEANLAQDQYNQSMAELAVLISPVTSELAQLRAQAAATMVTLASGFQDAVASGNPLLAMFTGLTVASGTLAVALNFSTITQALAASFNALKTAVLGVNAAMAANPAGVVIALLAGVATAIGTLWATNEKFRTYVLQTGQEIVTFISEQVGKAVTFFTQTIPNTVSTMAADARQSFQDLKSNISSTVGGIRDNIIGGFREAVDYIRNLPSYAVQWAGDFVQGYIRGLREKLSGLVGSVADIAQTIASYLHFSRPDVGPLRQYETWMPDMMKGMAKGITDNAWRLEDSLNAAASHMSIPAIRASGSGAAGGVDLGGVTIQINAPAGMDVNALADAVAYRLQTMIKQKEGVW